MGKTTYDRFIYIFESRNNTNSKHDYCFYLSALFVRACVKIIEGVTLYPPI